MVYVYREAVSDSARELADSLSMNARRIRSLQTAHHGQGLRAGDAVICWGSGLRTVPTGVKVLNAVGPKSKLEDATLLHAARVPTVEVSRTRPVVPTTNTTFDLNGFGNPVYHIDRVVAATLVARLQQFIATPPQPLVVWLPRTNNHMGGHDLLHPPATPDFFTKKEDLVEEYRLHIFNGKSIRAGKKVHRDGVTPHPWVRSYDGGWRIQYDNFSSTKDMRKVAAEAVKALGLEFGAVDLGRTRDGRLLVLEVNRAPGLEGGTVAAYATAVDNWIHGRE